MKQYRLLLWVALILILGLGGCSTPTLVPTSSPTLPPAATHPPSATAVATRPAASATFPPATPTPAPSATPPSSPTSVATPARPLPTLTAQPAHDYTGWHTYTNTTYSFVLRYPSGWVLKDDFPASNTMRGHLIQLTYQREPRIVLNVGFKRTDENQQITPTGMAGGEIVSRGSITFLGEPLPRRALVADGKDMAVFYGSSASVQRGNLAFWLTLSYAGSPNDQTTLTAETQATVDQIIESLGLGR